MGVDDRPCVIDFRVDPAEMCYPMVPAGACNDDIILDPRLENVRDSDDVLSAGFDEERAL